ncbi:hypothetical protein Aperf_G00000063498 [Anoplocephala perfoliata]
MALNLYMHSRNPYKTKKPSFRGLAQKYSFFSDAFLECEDERLCTHFKQPKFLAALARALLLEDYGLDVEFPLDRLIPTIPLRLNYILWVEDILSALPNCRSPPTVVDIGTGSCCIYPIIGAKKNGWNFIGSESDTRNYQHSLETIQRNNLADQIKLIRICDESSAPLQQVFDGYYSSMGVLPSQIMVDVVMANPPFFENVADAIGADSSRSFARPPPKSTSSAARNESQTLGGEVGFARRLAEDSLRYGNNVKVFTLMLGKKRSVPAVRRIMKELNITQTSVYEMCQGRVMRWGFAWTFIPNFQFPVSEFRRKRKFHRPPLTYTLPPTVSCLQKYSRSCLLEWIHHRLLELKMNVLQQRNKRSMGGCHLYAEAKIDTWTHSRRRRREAMANKPVEGELNATFLGKRRLPDDDLGLEKPAKRNRIEGICEDDTSWIEDILWDSRNVGGETIFKANFYVESQKKGFGGDSSSDDFSDSDDEEEEDGAVDGESRDCGKMEAGGCEDVDRLIISVQWLGGTDRDHANRVLCYLKNNLK